MEDISTTFTSCFPFLKIELYKATTVPLKKEVLPPHFPIGSLLNKKTLLKININKTTTIAELENSFSAIGLKAKAYRKSGNVWIETLLTSNWTLEKQNAEGEEISRHFNIKAT